MPLTIPTLDDRSYNQILAEALARIPVHNPEWTNFNDSDPGVTLLQLFAFMTENLLYRSNNIPERNRRKFLKLLQIPMQAASAARGLVTFSNPRGPLQSETLDPGLDLFAGPVPFRTEDGLDVLPLESQLYYKSPIPPDQQAEVAAIYAQLYQSFSDADPAALVYYETKPLPPPTPGAPLPALNLASHNDTIDGALWLALLARSPDPTIKEQTRHAIANKILTLGVLPALDDASRVLFPGGDEAADQPELLFELPLLPDGGALPTDPADRVANYRPLDARPSGSLLAEPGIVELPLPEAAALRLWPNLEPLEQGARNFPPSLEDTAVQDRLITWIRIRLRPEETAVSRASQLNARLSWVGLNAARVSQRLHVFAETLEPGNGEPDQVRALINTPVLPESITLTVNGEPWQRIEDLLTAAPEVPGQGAAASAASAQVFTLDRESGEIRFGNGLQGARPPRGALIRASYDYGGGRQGNVGIGSINKAPALPAGLKVTNPLPTWGGAEAESVAEAERRIPAYLQHRDRLISQTDFVAIARRAPGVELGRVEALPLLHPDIPDTLAPGVVTLLVIPRYDPAQPDAPQPDRLFLDTLCRYLDPRRVITTELHLRGPEYLPIWLSIGLDVTPGQEFAPVREAVKAALRRFLSPLTGGFSESGWPLQKAVDVLELTAVAARTPGVARITQLLLGRNSGGPLPELPLVGLQLPRLVGLSVQPGQPQPLDDLRGAGSPPPGATAVIPAPVIPPECL